MFELLKINLSKYSKNIHDIHLNFGPERKGDVKHSQANISLAKELLSYNPKFNFENGISEYINWYWNNK